MSDQAAEDQALEHELDRAAMATAKLALEAVTAFLTGEACIVIGNNKYGQTLIKFQPKRIDES